ncbi:MAG: putative glyoxalase superfamily protein PhnB [Planctomycetota bacterium]|jgi:uncharacterized glyoxalase superfamily protein PhnB
MSEPQLTPSTIHPSLSYDDAPAAIEFLCRVFGFKKRLVVPGPDGTVRHSELSLGPGVIMVHTSRPEQGRISPSGLPGVTQSLALVIDNPDEHYAHLKAEGADIIEELKDEDFGSRGYAVKDLEGHYWYFATYRPGIWWDKEGNESDVT